MPPSESTTCHPRPSARGRGHRSRESVSRATRKPRRSLASTSNESPTASCSIGAPPANGVGRAKADGRWEAAYDGMATSAVPEDLAAALEAAGLTDAFAGLSRQNRYAILHRVQAAKKAETRERRIAKYVGMLAAGETPY